MVVIDELINNKKDFQNLISETNNVLVFKFGAEWCGPCKKINPKIQEFKNTIKDDTRILWYDIDVDDSIEIFGMLKTKRVVNGVPAILVYFEENDQIYPDEFVLGANIDEIECLFSNVMKHIEHV